MEKKRVRKQVLETRSGRKKSRENTSYTEDRPQKKCRSTAYDLEELGIPTTAKVSVQDTVSRSRLSSCFSKKSPEESKKKVDDVPPGFVASSAGKALPCEEAPHSQPSQCREIADARCSIQYDNPGRQAQQENPMKLQDSIADEKLWKEPWWMYKDTSGVSQGPFTLMRLAAKHQEGTLSRLVEVRHFRGKPGPFELEKLIEFFQKGMLASILGAAQEKPGAQCRNDGNERHTRCVQAAGRHSDEQGAATKVSIEPESHSHHAREFEAGPAPSSVCPTSTGLHVVNPGIVISSVSSPLQMFQENLHSAVLKAAKGILDAVVGQYLQVWIADREARSQRTPADLPKDLFEERPMDWDKQVFSSGEVREVHEDMKAVTRKPDSVSPSKKQTRRRLVKLTERDFDSASQHEDSSHEISDAAEEPKVKLDMAEDVSQSSPQGNKQVMNLAEDAAEASQSKRKIETEKQEAVSPSQKSASPLEATSQEVEIYSKRELKTFSRSKKRKEQVSEHRWQSRLQRFDSKGCARCYVTAMEWREWSRKARDARAQVARVSDQLVQDDKQEITRNGRKTRAHVRNLAELKVSQLQARRKRLKLVPSKIHAWGLVALEPIKSQDFVIEYVGEVIRSKVADLRERQYLESGQDSSYLFRIDNDVVVDATKRGGLARFINHSCDPNCYTRILHAEGRKRIFIYAKKDILPGTELTYDYKFPIEEKKVPCYCGAARCRKYMC